ncbi:hypothetical protein IAR55_002728 [Kwoniella newhampshirensis]|uniref:UBC core domain-containing protein n=1 Tax=Kwoniella newhampshirensis TaxID=1651941 RepID=A0AAW0Z020_9TREE
MPPKQASAPGTAAKRIKKEIADLSREDLGAITLAPNESNIFQWKATLPGPAGSAYEGGVFEIDIKVPEDYPFSPPQLRFVTKVYHCNVANTGAICLDLLKHAWSPALSLYKVILSLSSLLTDPNPADPLVPAIAQEYRHNRKKHDATAREWVKKFATPKSASAPTTTRAVPSASTSRPRAIQRPSASSTSTSSSAAVAAAAAGPSPQIAGTRRTASRAVIDIEDDSDVEDVEVLGEGSRASTVNGNGNTIGATTAPGGGPRRGKRARVGAGPGAGGGAGAGASVGDAIVIDE